VTHHLKDNLMKNRAIWLFLTFHQCVKMLLCINICMFFFFVEAPQVVIKQLITDK
jgi:hypothetical protein